MKKNLIILSVSLFGLIILSSSAKATVTNNYQNRNQAEFGSCYADPIYDTTYTAQTIISSNVSNERLHPAAIKKYY